MAYVNPLDDFQSHNVHYVVLAARTTEDVRLFSESSGRAQVESLQSIDRVTQLGGEVKPGVFLMLDTRRFSQFMVNNFQIETYVAGFNVPGSKTPNSTAVNMSFTVIDSMGISFANFLQYLMDQKLQVSYNGMTLLVMVMFVGHHEDGTSSVVQAMSMPAIFNQIQVDLNDVKGVYECKLFPLSGMISNAGHNSKWTSIGRASSYFTGVGSNTLGAVVNSFEKRLNDELLERYRSFNSEDQSGGTRKDVGRFGRPVQYMITIPEKWETFAFFGPSMGGAVETSFQEIVKRLDEKLAKNPSKAAPQTQPTAKDSFVAVDPELTITEVLDVIFSQTVEVSKLGNFTNQQDKDGMIRFYKHLVTVTSDDSSFTVHIDVVEFSVPNVALNEKPGGSTGENDQQLYETSVLPNGQVKKTPKNYMEFDYIFSGKNIDVLALDLKIENLNWLLMQNTKLGQGELFVVADDAQTQTDGTGAQEAKRMIGGMRAKDPALMPQRTHGEATNHANYGYAENGANSPQTINQRYMQNLAAFYNAGPVTAKLELRGNPRLMADVAPIHIPQHVSAITITDAKTISKTNVEVKKKYREAFERDVLRVKEGQTVSTRILTGPSHVSSPVFVKVNVFGPNVDFITNDFIEGQTFTQPLFQDNFYFLSQIVSKIDGTRFTQELELLSYSVYGAPNTSAKGGSTPSERQR